MLRNILILLALILIAGAAVIFKNKGDRLTIYVNQFADRAAFDDVVDGLKTSLKENGVKANLSVESAHASMARAEEIAHAQAAKKPRIVVAIATGSLQAALKVPMSEKTLLAFAGVSDARVVGVTKGQELMGITNQAPVEDLVAVIDRALPNKKRIGIIYTSSEVNAVKSMEAFKAAAAEAGLKVVAVPISNASEIELAMSHLNDEADVIFVPQDNLLSESIELLTKSALEKKIPVIGTDTAVIEKGLLVALGYDHFEMGRELGHMITDVLNGKKVEPRIRSATVLDYKVNEKIAAELGIDVAALVQAKP